MWIRSNRSRARSHEWPALIPLLQNVLQDTRPLPDELMARRVACRWAGIERRGTRRSFPACAGTPPINARAWLRHERVVRDDGPVSTPDRSDSMRFGGPGEPADPSAGEAPKNKRSRWIWICALLALGATGLLIWALTIQSDLDSTQQELDSTQQELAGTSEALDSTKQELDATSEDVEALQSEDDGGNRTGALLVGGKALYDQLAEQLDATNEDLAATQQDLEEAEKAAAQADQQAKAAKQAADEAGDKTDKAKAQADQAQAEVRAAESRATVVRDCAKAYISALGVLFEGESGRDQAPAVREELSRITAICKDRLAAS
jgi:hypothetical protein